MDSANPRTNVAEKIARGENARIVVHTLADRYIVMRRLIDAGYSDVHSALQDPGTRPGWSYRASWEITGTAPRNPDVCEWCVSAGRGNWKDAAKFCACDACKCHPAPAPRTRTRSYPSPELCCDDLDCPDRAEIQASWYRANRTAIDWAIRVDDAELSTGDDDEDPSGDCAEFSIEDVRAHIAGSSILGAPAPAQPIEWEHTRRGLIGLAEIRTPRPSGSDLASVVWFAESGESGREDGANARTRAIAMAYVALCSSARTLAGELSDSELRTIISARSSQTDRSQ